MVMIQARTVIQNRGGSFKGKSGHFVIFFQKLKVAFLLHSVYTYFIPLDLFPAFRSNLTSYPFLSNFEIS